MGYLTNLSTIPFGSRDTADALSPCLHAYLFAPTSAGRDACRRCSALSPPGSTGLPIGSAASLTSSRRARLPLADQTVGVPSDMDAHAAHAENNRVLQPCRLSRPSCTQAYRP